jgi:type II secretory pathway component PulC
MTDTSEYHRYVQQQLRATIEGYEDSNLLRIVYHSGVPQQKGVVDLAREELARRGHNLSEYDQITPTEETP